MSRSLGDHRASSIAYGLGDDEGLFVNELGHTLAGSVFWGAKAIKLGLFYAQTRRFDPELPPDYTTAIGTKWRYFGAKAGWPNWLHLVATHCAQ